MLVHSFLPSFFPCSLCVGYLENTHKKVSGRAGIIVVLTPRDFSWDLLQNLAEGFSTVGSLISVCTAALFMKFVKM